VLRPGEGPRAQLVASSWLAGAPGIGVAVIGSIDSTRLPVVPNGRVLINAESSAKWNPHSDSWTCPTDGGQAASANAMLLDELGHRQCWLGHSPSNTAPSRYREEG
jgi:hypothetical protein